MFALNLNPLAWLALVVALSGYGIAGVQTLRLFSAQKDISELAQSADAARLDALQAKLKGIADVRHKEEQLAAEAAQTQKEIHDQVTAISAQRDALALRVRSIIASTSGQLRVSGTSQTPSLGGAAFRSEDPFLLGSLGEEDVEEAARADTLRTHYLACEAQYELARAALNGSDAQ